jgi:hypothetical protein
VGAGVDRREEQMLDARHRSWVTGLVALLLLVIGACSDPEDVNYVEVTDQKLAADRPAAWSTEFPVDAPWTKGFRLTPDSVEQIQLSGDFGEYITAAQGMGSLIGKAQLGLKEFTVVQTRDISIPGATTAQVVRYTITDNTGSQLSGEWIVAAHWPYPQAVAVSVLTPAFNPDLERRILESMELRPVLK